MYAGLTTRADLSQGKPCNAGSVPGRSREQDLIFQVYQILPTGDVDELDAREWLEWVFTFHPPSRGPHMHRRQMNLRSGRRFS